MDIEQLREWIGRTEQAGDQATAAPLAALAASLDRDDPEPLAGSEIPPLWHWLYFLPRARQSALGPDGHPRRGGFLPPVPLPRRMWAGGRLEFQHPLRVGEAITRTSRILDVSAKQGRSGALAFVTVRHEIAHAQGTAITEEHDIVYRDASSAGAPASAGEAAPAPTPAGQATPAPTPVGQATHAPTPAGQAAPVDESFAREIVPDPVLLFRYSALTFNGHRIHYDRNYVTEVEGYPGLVVHGPLIATLLLDLLRRQLPQASVLRFTFKAMSPVFDIERFAVCGRADGERRYALWARKQDGTLAMQASAEIG